MNLTRKISLSTLVTAMLCTVSHAATLYWDGTDTTPDADGGSGIWSSSTSLLNWNDAPTAGTPIAWVNNNNAVFGGTGGTITLDGPLTAADTIFETAGYIIDTAGHDLTLGKLDGEVPFTKTGAGTLTLNKRDSTFTGYIIVEGGILKIGHSYDVLGPEDDINKVVVKPGGTFDVNGHLDIFYNLDLTGHGSEGQGAFINTGGDTGSGRKQTPNIRLGGNTTIGGTGDFYMIGAGFEANNLKLNTHTLTKVGPNTFYLAETTVTRGTINIVEGKIGLNRNASASETTFIVADTPGAGITTQGYRLNCGSVSGGGTNGGEIIIDSGGTLRAGYLDASTTYAGTIVNNGTLEKVGAGTFNLTGSSSGTGLFRVNNGNLKIDATLDNPVEINELGSLSGNGSTSSTLTLNGGHIHLAGGSATDDAFTADSITISKPLVVLFDTPPSTSTTYTILNYGSGGITGVDKLLPSYDGTFTDDIANQRITFTTGSGGALTRTWNTLDGSWDQGASANWLEDDNLFTNGHHVVFGEIDEDVEINIATTVIPSSITVSNSEHNYTFTGNEKLLGSAPLIKNNTGTLTIQARNNGFSGPVLVEKGTLIINDRHALGLHAPDGTPGRIVVSNGATIDFNGVNDAVFGYTISGNGVDGNGALVNNGSAIDEGKKQTIRISLSDDASVGGTDNWALLGPNHTTTWLDLNGHTLTKLGTNTISLVSTAVTPGTLHIAEGMIKQYNSAKHPLIGSEDLILNLADNKDVIFNLDDLDMSLGSLTGGGEDGGEISLHNSELKVGFLGGEITYSGAFRGNNISRFTKVGTGTMTIEGHSPEFKGKVIIAEGTLKLNRDGAGIWAGNVLGQEYNHTDKVTVLPGATLDINGFANTTYGFTIAGSGFDNQGALVNNADTDTSLNNIQIPIIELSDDATIGGTGNFGIIARGYGASSLLLNGHTLTKKGSNTFFAINTTISEGTIYIAEGTFANSPRRAQVMPVQSSSISPMPQVQLCCSTTAVSQSVPSPVVVPPVATSTWDQPPLLLEHATSTPPTAVPLPVVAASSRLALATRYLPAQAATAVQP